MNKKIFFYLYALIVIIIFFLISIPIFSGFCGTILQSLGYFFAEDNQFTFVFFKKLINLPGLNKSVFLCSTPNKLVLSSPSLSITSNVPV